MGTSRSRPRPDRAEPTATRRPRSRPQGTQGSSAAPYSATSKARWHTFFRTETGSAALLLAAVVAALLWANLAPHSYESVWSTHLSVELGGHGLSLDIHEWINSGLMTFFFLVVGLEARRELDMGELRDQRRILLSIIAGVFSMLVPALIYIAFTSGGPSVHGWGIAMSTDTAFALGILAVLGRRLPASLRVFMLAISVVDDVVALIVIAVFYSGDITLPALCVALAALAVLAALPLLGRRHGAPMTLLAVIAWVGLLEAGIDPVVTGLVVGVLVVAYPAARADLERASDQFIQFREQPTPQLHRSVVRRLAASISPNDRLERTFLPWVSFLIVPLFALANAGVPLSTATLADAYTSPITLGIIVGCLAGKIAGVVGSLALARWISAGRLRPTVGWGAATAGGAVAGAAFTVSLLIASLAFSGPDLNRARIGVLTTVVGALLLSWTVTAAIRRLPPKKRARALLGTSEPLTDLAVPVDPDRDHIRGTADAVVTVVEYGDFQCPYCGLAEPAVRELLAGYGTVVRYVWRHLPLTDVHPDALTAAEASEAAAEQDRFWEMHDALLNHQDALAPADLLRYARQIGVDIPAFQAALHRRRAARHVAEDVDSADLSGVSGTPTFFINGVRHHGAYDLDTLIAAVELARQRALAGDAGTPRYGRATAP
ncbi:Na+/H+ antiporter NhaA [Streptomyces sp. NPDC059271]|uniref:Na+/H+ antiporter NhaA n=1 Tax=Streptomyces sp. NPDC059271 TaxID=3346799 RepID=UPI0036B800AD